MNEGGKLFGMRKYKEARVAYEDAWNSEDIIPSLRPAIRESIAQSATCMLDAKEFMEMVNTYNPDDF